MEEKLKKTIQTIGLLLGVTFLLPIPILAQKTCQQSIPDLYRQVAPAVVSITATAIDPFSTGPRSGRVLSWIKPVLS
ncbi:hypothetical protein KKI24_07825 [bacterium]|nr:hypothetical protein [bacterium]